MALPAIFDTLRLPLMGSPMFIISGKELVLAQCKAGIVGTFPSLNARAEGEFEQWLIELNEELDKYNQANPDRPAAPFGVNLIVHRTNPRVEEDLELCVKYKVPIIITSLGAREDVNQAVHSYGGITLHDVVDNMFAKKAIQKGADGVIAVAAGAGGHAGTTSPFALVQEIREWFDGPLLLSGCIANGEAILASLALGADLAYAGSPFIATQEANAVDGYKEMVADSDSSDIIYTSAISGVHGNYLRPSLINSGIDPETLTDGDPSQLAKLSGGDAKAWKNIWGCGQGVGAIKSVDTAADRIAEFSEQYKAAKARVDSLFG